MIRKSIVKEPIFEAVQTGLKDKEVWITSDGKQHNDEYKAISHEKFNVKMKRRHVPNELTYSAEIVEFSSLQDFKDYEEEFIDDQINYDINKLSFPNTYVIYTSFIDSEDEYDSYPNYHINCATKEEFIQMLIESVK